MWIQKLSLNNFRSHENFTMQLTNGIQLIYGDNGAGKTNIIEALSLLTNACSFKTRYLYEATQFQKDGFSLKARYHASDVEQNIQLHYHNRKKELIHNQTKITQTEWVGNIPFTTYLPSDMLEILKAPSERRKFINLFICQKESLYTKHLLYYTKVLRQKNAHLKSDNICQKTLDALDKSLRPSTIYLQEKRTFYIHELSKTLCDIYQEITEDKESVSLAYAPCHVEQEGFLKEQREQDIRYGTSQIGPHRDEIHILLNGSLAQKTGSEGQKTSLILALKLAEQRLLDSIIAIDDFGAHLDKKRTATLLKYLSLLKKQIFITTTNDLDIKANKHEILCRALIS